jgi:hypothetical protein
VIAIVAGCHSTFSQACWKLYFTFLCLFPLGYNRRTTKRNCSGAHTYSLAHKCCHFFPHSFSKPFLFSRPQKAFFLGVVFPGFVLRWFFVFYFFCFSIFLCQNYTFCSFSIFITVKSIQLFGGFSFCFPELEVGKKFFLCINFLLQFFIIFHVLFYNAFHRFVDTRAELYVLVVAG